jgi:hypothetical protein
MLVWMPTLADWIVIGPVCLLFLINPYHVMDRILDQAQKNTSYGLVINIFLFLICLPYYLRLRKRLRKYQEDTWDQ